MRLVVLSFFLSVCFSAYTHNSISSDSSLFNKLTTVNDLKTRGDTLTEGGKTVPETPQWSVKLGGYIGTDLFWDTRQVVESRDGLLLFYPEDVKQDINGRDINARPSFNFLALNTRLTIRIQAPDALGARVSGMVEGWFAGISNNDMNGLSMRHAFLKLDWKHTSLLMGQTWHPLFTENCFANTVTGSAGAPFQPFSRAPQIRLTQNLSHYRVCNTRIMFYINAQRDFLSFGSAGNSSSYLRNSAIPEMGLQYIYDRCRDMVGKTLWGIGIDYKYLIPRIVTDSNVYTRNGLHALTATAFIYFQGYLKKDILFETKAKALYGQACNEFLLLGGYAYQYYDNQPLDPRVNYTYTSINTAAAWIDISVFKDNREWEFGLFGGYSQNLGSNKNIQDWNNPNAYFSRGYNIKYLYRVSARAVYQANKLQFGLEPEYTVACYGNTRNSLGEIQNPSADYPNATKNTVANLRILFSTILYF